MSNSKLYWDHRNPIQANPQKSIIVLFTFSEKVTKNTFTRHHLFAFAKWFLNWSHDKQTYSRPSHALTKPQNRGILPAPNENQCIHEGNR